MKRNLIMLIISTFLIQATVFADETPVPSSIKQKFKIKLSGKDFDWPDWDMFRGDRDISDLLNMATTAPEPNGTMFFTEKCKGLSVRLPDGTVNSLLGMSGTDGYSMTAADLFCNGQAGMNGVALDPNFDTNNTIFVYLLFNCIMC